MKIIVDIVNNVNILMYVPIYVVLDVCYEPRPSRIITDY